LVEHPNNTVTINGIIKDDGSIVEIVWTQVSGPAVTLAGTNTETLSLSDLVEGEYVFSLNITDDGGLSDTDKVNVTVLPGITSIEPPVVSAGDDLFIQLPDNTLTITASAESAQGLIASYKWTQVEGNTVNIVSDTTAVLVLKDLITGNYTFTITVLDNFGLTATDEVRISVLEENPSANPRNLFSPDNKGDINSETWTITNATLLDGCEITVYSRHGQKVYSSIGYPVPWDGTYNGSPVPDGAYFYKIMCTGQRSQTGSVTITRFK
jgi:gliding motility-associated-like protein